MSKVLKLVLALLAVYVAFKVRMVLRKTRMRNTLANSGSVGNLSRHTFF